MNDIKDYKALGCFKKYFIYINKKEKDLFVLDQERLS